MGYMLKDRLEVSIFINDKEIPLDKTNVLNYIHIATTVTTKVPVMSLSITDMIGIVPKMGLQDGIPISISIKALNGKTRVYKFRKFDHTPQLTGGANTYIISGYWDNPLYWATTTFKGIQGNSSDVIAQIGSACGIKTEVDVTNDNQLWLPQNQSYSAFAKSTASCGYINDDSCMALGIDLDGTLIYKDVNKDPNGVFNVVAYQRVEGSLSAVDFNTNFASGFNNSTVGYQNARYTQSLMNDLQTLTDKLQFNSDSRNPDLNRKLKDKVNRGQVRFGPIDVGNVHLNYEKAQYQNARYKALFSTHLEFLTPYSNNLRLMDGVNFSAQKLNGDQDTVTSGVYLITGKAIYIEGATYSEKIVCARHGTNETQVEA